ncbi:hypothetical protein FRB94_003500 [Tulasnella sp. JGI-2019a]|nr:hypothetical protein FRB94_003500 [Tulasnella sp. JGI-2019a]
MGCKDKNTSPKSKNRSSKSRGRSPVGPSRPPFEIRMDFANAVKRTAASSDQGEASSTTGLGPAFKDLRTPGSIEEDDSMEEAPEMPTTESELEGAQYVPSSGGEGATTPTQTPKRRHAELVESGKTPKPVAKKSRSEKTEAKRTVEEKKNLRVNFISK